MSIDPVALIASADEIDNRLGPIPGRSSDRIARELRSAAQLILDLCGEIAAQVAATKSAPPILTSRTSGERLPSSDAAVGGADTVPDAWQYRYKITFGFDPPEWSAWQTLPTNWDGPFSENHEYRPLFATSPLTSPNCRSEQ